MEIILLAINQLNTAFNFMATGLLILAKEFCSSSISIVKKIRKFRRCGERMVITNEERLRIYDAFPYRIKNFPFFTEFAHNLFFFFSEFLLVRYSDRETGKYTSSTALHFLYYERRIVIFLVFCSLY
jgi:hypothetical protein